MRKRTRLICRFRKYYWFAYTKQDKSGVAVTVGIANTMRALQPETMYTGQRSEIHGGVISELLARTEECVNITQAAVFSVNEMNVLYTLTEIVFVSFIILSQTYTILTTVVRT